MSSPQRSRLLRYSALLLILLYLFYLSRNSPRDAPRDDSHIISKSGDKGEAPREKMAGKQSNAHGGSPMVPSQRQTTLQRSVSQRVDYVFDAPVDNSPGRRNNPKRGRAQTVLIPTECLDGYQEWQQVVAVNSLKRLQMAYPDSQTFDIVRLVACDDPDKKILQHNRDLSELHVSRVYSTTERGIFAPTLNKPGVLMNWLINGPGQDLDDDHELVVVDVDFFFKAPIPFQQSKPGLMRVGKFHMGREFFQEPALQKFCRGACQSWTSSWLAGNGIGPPYVIRKVDAVRLFPLWYEITYEMVNAGNPDQDWQWPGHWFADMWAMMFALELTNGLKAEYDYDSWIVSADYGLWQHITDIRKQTSKYDVTAYKLANMTYNEALGRFKGKFNKHDWRANGAKLMLQCNKDVQLAIWVKHGWQVPPEILAPTPPSIGIVPGAPKVDNRDIHGQRNMYVWWHLYHHINDAFSMWRKDNCPPK